MFQIKNILLSLVLFQLFGAATAQIDTAVEYVNRDVAVIGYSLQKSPASVDTLQPMLHQPSFTLVSGLNTLPGVRMEERSPGSYRLSIRGSLLRSPFGVRNIKIYLDDFPLTDAGGNTYLNALDASSISSMEIWRGPYGSLYGANTGGVVRIRSYEQRDTNHVNVSVNGGSYGLFQQTLRVQQKWKKHFLTVNQAYQRSDGYRNQSALKRQFYQASYYVDYRRGMRFKALAFYSDLNYQTPGGLTLSEYQHNPQAARPTAGTMAGAEQQQAHVRNKMIYTGIAHDAKIGKHWRHVISIFATHNNFVNPAIATYEMRKETTYGTRTYLEASGSKSYRLSWNWNVGLEWQKTQSMISNYGNNLGVRDTLQMQTDLNARQYFLFTQFSATIFNRLIVEAGLSLNNYRYVYRSENFSEDWHTKQFDIQVLPRIALSYKIREQLLWRASVSKGYSAPTLAEIRPNDNVVHEDLQPEYGWNYETGLRFQNKRLQADAAVFYYELKHAIVSRSDVSGAQYFVNAGGTKQRGLETKLTYQLIQKRSHGFIRYLELKNSFTWYVFSFDQYVTDVNDYSGNRLTGVPRTTVVTSIYVELLKGLYMYVQYNHTARIPLNDGNTAFASSYHLLQTKIGWNFPVKQQTIGLYIGVDNILNEQYSLGNDLNAFGGRYYNAAPLRNFYAGAVYRF
jgi:iron complex outermembrane receptor protein